MNSYAQLNLFAAPPPSTAIERNSLNARAALKPDGSGRRRAADALAERVVDDRVFSMGVTNWKAVIDRALKTGHTEIFVGDDDRPGLRKAGYRYAPLPRLPERAVEYIKGQLLILGVAAMINKKRKLPTVRDNLPSGGVFVVAAKESFLDLGITAPGGELVTLTISLANLPFTDGAAAEDAKRIATYLRGILKAHIRDRGVAPSLSSKDISAIGTRIADLASAIGKGAA